MAVRGDNSLFFATGVDNSGLLKGKAEAESIVSSLGSSISRINPFAALAVGAVAAFALIANEGYKLSRDFQSAMAEVKTIANVSEKEFSKLEQSVFGIYKRLGTEPPDKLANGLYEIIGAGFEAGDALNVLEISSKAATAGVTTTAVAADGLTTILNAFKLSTSDAQNVADIMFATVDRGKISFEELSSQIATVAPLAASSNISFEEIGAAISTLTKQGVPASVAMTQIRSAIIATNEVLGDGAFKTLTLQEGLQKMYETADGSQNKLKELAGRIEAVNGIISLAGDNFVGASEDLDAMANSAGSVDRSFNTITSTNANQWEIFGNRIKATTKGIGDAVLDMSTKVVTDLNKMFESSDQLSAVYKEQAAKINDLYIEYTSLNVEEKRRLEILEEIKAINPSVVEGINNEAEAYNRLGSSVRAYNEYVLNKEIVDKKFGKDISNTVDVIDDFKTKSKNIQVELYEDYADFVSKLPKLRDQYQEDLNAVLDGEGSKLDKIRKIRQIISDNNKNIGPGSSSFVSVPFSDIKQYDDAIGAIDIFQKLLDNLQKDYDNTLNNLQDNIASSKYIIEEIKKINSIEDLQSKFGSYETPQIKEAYQEQIKYIEKRKEVAGVISEIGKIQTAQYEKDGAILKKYLESENEEIRKAAEKRKAFFEFKPAGGKPETETFSDNLQTKEQQFKDYNLAIKNSDDELAEKLKKNYKLKEEDYISYLRNLYTITKDEGQKALILEALDKSGSGINLRDKAESASVLKPGSINLDFKIDTTSINALNRQLEILNEEWKSATTQTERDILQIKIDAKNKQLSVAKGYVKQEGDLYGNITKSISDLNNKQLRDYIEYWRKKLKTAKKGSDEAAEAEGNIENATEKIAEKAASAVNKIGGALNELSGLFSKFGDEDTAQLLDQLSGVAEGVAQTLTGNPLDIIQGSLKILNSALTVEVVSDTAKFEEAIKQLEKAIDKLDYVISKSIGSDKVSSRKEAIKDLQDLEKQADNAYKAELAARKEVKLLGVSLGKKGAGSGTDPAKLDELEQKAEDARRKVEELKEQLAELYTGTTHSTIVDSIISGLKEGKSSVADFADNFKELMQDAMLQAFQIKYLEKEIEKFYDAFASAGEDQNFTAEEINSLRDLYSSIIEGAQGDIDAINDILNSSGIGGFGSSDKKGLAGSISETITEETASIWAGTLNSIRIDIARGLDIAVENTQFLSQIATNTGYNRYLENLDQMNDRLGQIETLLR